MKINNFICFFFFRVIASNLVAFVGYIGGTVSIIVVGYLVDDHCLTLIVIISAHVGGKNNYLK